MGTLGCGSCGGGPKAVGHFAGAPINTMNGLMYTLQSYGATADQVAYGHGQRWSNKTVIVTGRNTPHEKLWRAEDRLLAAAEVREAGVRASAVQASQLPQRAVVELFEP